LNTDTETINAILNKLLELINLWIQGASLNLLNQSTGITKITMYISIASTISSIILMIVTAWYAILTRKIVKNNESMVQQNIMPFLYISPPYKHTLGSDMVTFIVNVANIGRGPALDIEIESLPEGLWCYAITDMLQVKSDCGLGIKATTEEMERRIESIPGKHYDFSSFSISLKYKDMDGNSYLASWPKSEDSKCSQVVTTKLKPKKISKLFKD